MNARFAAVTDPELVMALEQATCIDGCLSPEERVPGPVFELLVDAELVGHAWRPDEPTAMYLLRARGLGRRH